jgi:hypothetical protein
MLNQWEGVKEVDTVGIYIKPKHPLNTPKTATDEKMTPHVPGYQHQKEKEKEKVYRILILKRQNIVSFPINSSLFVLVIP